MLAAEPGTVRLAGGLTAVEHGPGTTAKPAPVLLLHGMMGGAWQFEWLQDALATAGYRSLAINYRGHHDSRPVSRLGHVGVHDYLRDALSACTHLGTRPIVIGQSMGGLIAQLVAERGAARATVLSCSLPPAGIRWRSVSDLRMARGHAAATLSGRPLQPDRAELDDLIFNRIPAGQRPEFFSRQVPESSRAAMQIALGLIGVRRRHVNGPVLSLTTGLDRLVLPSVGHAIARRYRADTIHLHDAGHYALVGEPGWRAAATQVIEWIDAT